MEIYLLSIDDEMTRAWEKYFANMENVKVVCKAFDSFMRMHNVECVVSPANSFGFMDGGYDAAITRRFGEELQLNVQRYIREHYFGEQPVGSSFIIETPQKGVKLIHTPTMRIPEKIYDPSVIYHCMRTCLMTALGNNVKSIVIPAFGGATGMVKAETVAEMMWKAYVQIFDESKKIATWDSAVKSHFR